MQPGDSTRLALIADALRQGQTAFEPDKEMAEVLNGRLPGAWRLINWTDWISSELALQAVTSGIETVVFGGTGYPHRTAPHKAAAAASATARFVYPSVDEVVAALRAQSLEGDRQAVALEASILDPARFVELAGLHGIPIQLQWGLAAWLFTSEEAAGLVASWAPELAPGSQVVITACERAGEIGQAAGEPWHGHTAADLVGWAKGAGLDVTEAVEDVRGWHREDWQDLPVPAAGRVSMVIAVRT